MTRNRLDPTHLAPARRLRSPDYLHYRSLYRELHHRRDRLQGVVVDVGCGNQPYRSMLTPAAVRYIGADVTAPGSSADVEIVNDQLVLDDRVADAVLCTQVLEHSPRPQVLLCDIARVLRPGGTVVLTVPFYWPHHEEPHDYFRFTRYGLALLCEQAGLAVEEMVPCGGRWSVAGLAAIHAGNGRILRLAVNASCGLLDWRARDTVDWQTSTILCVATRT